MSRHRALVGATLIVLFTTTPVMTSQEPAPSDDAAIRWITPGHFTAARERARRENRLLIIKGISFGVDEDGAHSATRGTW